MVKDAEAFGDEDLGGEQATIVYRRGLDNSQHFLVPYTCLYNYILKHGYLVAHTLDIPQRIFTIIQALFGLCNKGVGGTFVQPSFGLVFRSPFWCTRLFEHWNYDNTPPD